MPINPATRHQLINLLLRNKGTGQGLRIQAADDGSEATVYVYDVLVEDELWAEWVGGVAPRPFAEQLNAIDAETIHLRINSPGGDVFAARPIEQSLREHPARIVTHIDGYAASAATIVALAGHEIRMNPGGFFMIHEAWTIALGNASALEADAALLRKVDSSIRQTYMGKTGAKEDDVRQWMEDETWFTADEAKAAGFVDIVEDPAAGTRARARAWDLSAYAHAPSGAPQPDQSDPAPAPQPEPQPEPAPAAAIKTYDLAAMRREVEVTQLTA